MRDSVWVLIVLFAFLLMAGCNSRLTSADAERIAERRIGEYAKSESLDTAVFGKPKISSEANGTWVFDYTSSTVPRHLVRVLINSDDAVEMSRMIEE